MEIIYENKNEKSLVRLTRFDILKFSKYELLEQCNSEEVKEIHSILEEYYEDILFEVIDIEEYVSIFGVPFEYFDLVTFLYKNMRFGDINVFMYNNKFVYVRIYP